MYGTEFNLQTEAPQLVTYTLHLRLKHAPKAADLVRILAHIHNNMKAERCQNARSHGIASV